MLAVRNEAILAAVPDIIMEVDGGKRYTWANQAGMRFFGEDVVGREASYYFEGEQKTYNKVQPLFDGVEDVLYVESWQRRRDGKKRLLAWWCKVLKDKEGLVTGALSTGRDITERKQAEEALFESEERYRALVDNASDIVFKTDSTGHFTFVNPAGIRLIGYEKEEVIGRHYPTLIRPDMREEAMKFFSLQFVKGLQNTYFEYPVITKAGGEIWLGQNTKLIMQDGNVTGFQAIARDITERKRMEKALQESEERFRLLAENARDTIWTMDMNLRYTYMSPYVKHALDYTPEEYVKIPLNKVMTPASLERCMQILAEELEIEKREKKDLLRSRTVEVEHIHRNGSIVWVEIKMTFIRNAAGQATGILGYTRDITDRKQAEEAIRASEEKYRSILESIEDGYFEVDLAGNMMFFNPAMCKIANMSAEQLRGMNNREYTSPDTAKKMFTVFNEIYRTGKPGKVNEYEIITKSGFRGNLELSASLIRNREGIPIGFRGIVRDVTERKMWEETLRRSEEKYRSILENIQEGYFEVDLDGKLTFFNDVLCTLSGYSRDELLGMQNMEYLASESTTSLRKVFGEVYRTGQPSGIVDYDVVTKDGKIINAALSASLIKDEKGKPRGFRAVARNVTERKQAEERLRRSEEKFRFLTEHMNDNIFTMDMNLRTTYVSPSMKRILGFTPEERMKQHITEQVTPASMALIERILSEELEREQKGLGDPDRSIKFEVEYYHKDGSTVWMENVISGIRDDQGVLVGIHGVSRDITERKESELALIESFERLRKSLGATVQAMAVTVEARDPYTAGHQRRVADLARAIATELKLSVNQIEGIRMAAAIHDLGKISVPAEILSKPTRLMKIEFELIKTHAQSGYDILKDIDFPWPIARIILEHHEHTNGSGYPKGLRGEETLLESKILTVADVVEAIASHRPYRPSLGIDKALEEIEQNRGVLYDPEIADACLRVFREKGYQLEGV